jgi:hypothetical protein
MSNPAFGTGRAPCQGWPGSRQLGRINRRAGNEIAVPYYTNTTVVPDYHDPPGDDIPPYARIDTIYCGLIAGAHCCETGYPLCDAWPRVYWPQTFADTSTTSDISVCLARGHKVTQSGKHWFGRMPFGWCPGTCEPKPVRYLSITREVRVDFRYAGTDYFQRAKRTFTQDRYSGVVTESNREDEDQGQLYVLASGQDSVQSWFNGDFTCQYDFVTSFSYDAGLWELANGYRAPIAATGTTAAETISFPSATSTSRSIDWNLPYDTTGADTTYRVQIWWTLSSPYTEAELFTEANDALAEWDITDSLIQPWRTDGWRSVGPQVFRDEYYSEYVDMGYTVAAWTDTSGYTGDLLGAPLAHYSGFSYGFEHFTYDYACLTAPCPDNTTWHLAYYGAQTGANETGLDPSDVVITPFSDHWTNNYVASDLYSTGAFLKYGDGETGLLEFQKSAEVAVPINSFNFFRPAGLDRLLIEEVSPVPLCKYDNFVNGTEANPEIEMDGLATGFSAGDPVVIFGTSIDGLWTIDTITTASGRDTLKLKDFVVGSDSLAVDAADLRGPTEGYGFGLVGKQRFPAAWPITGRTSVTAATATNPVAVTFADATALCDGDSVAVTGIGVLTNGTYTFTRTGEFTGTLAADGSAGAFTSGGYASSPGAPDYLWNDTRSKGQFVVCEWEADETTGTIAAAVTVTEYCKKVSVCGPSAIAISPNGEADDNWVVHPFPTELTLTTCGAEWRALIVQAVPDPLYQSPYTGCDTGDLTYPAVPYVEPITDTQLLAIYADGAPTLPTGCAFNLPSAPTPPGHTDAVVNEVGLQFKPWEITEC